MTAIELFEMMQAVLDWKHFNLPIETINVNTVELSTWTFEDAMSFVEPVAELELA